MTLMTSTVMILYYHNLLKVNLLGHKANQPVLRVSRLGLRVRVNHLKILGQNQNLVVHREDLIVHPLIQVHLVLNQEEPKVHLMIRVHLVHPVMQVNHAHQEDQRVHPQMKAHHVQKVILARAAMNTQRHLMMIYKNNV